MAGIDDEPKGLIGELYGIEIVHNYIIGDTREHDEDFTKCWCHDTEQLFPSKKHL
jgi:hypothetical protein